MLLGQQPIWTYPERELSINILRDFAVMDRRLQYLEIRPRRCWAALAPARPCLQDAFTKIERLFSIDTNQVDLACGETTNPGYSFDRFMYGRDVFDAQPAIIFDSKSTVYRKNAKKILHEAAIEVDARGIGLQFYERGPVLLGGQDTRVALVGNSGIQESSSTKGFLHYTTGISISTELVTCTMGGLISINGNIFGLTVGHAFSHRNAGKAFIKRSGEVIGSLAFKSGKHNERDLDWALCIIDSTWTYLFGEVAIAESSTLGQFTVATNDPGDATVSVYCGSGIVNGFIMAGYSLVALPGKSCVQRMWVVILNREVVPGDCGAWVVDEKSGDIYGYVVAGKPQTTVCYILLMRDVLEDISNHLQQPGVKIPSMEELVQSSAATLNTALQFATGCGRIDMIEYLVEEGDEVGMILSWAARSGHEVLVKLLMEKGALLDERDDEGRTPLSWAAQGGHVAVVKLLLESGAFINERDRRGRTALSWATRFQHEATVKMLLEMGADANLRDWGGRMPLSWAAQAGYDAAVKMLLEKGADVNPRDADGRTALLWATLGGHSAVVKTLLEKGANANLRDNDGRTALSRAAQSGHEAVVKSLLEHGPPTEESVRRVRKQPLAWAAEGGFVTVVKLLLEGGADASRPELGSPSALSLAAQGGHEAVVKILLDWGADANAQEKENWNAVSFSRRQ